MQADTLSPGTQLAGRYRIEDLVGETPRSQTWRALDRVLNRSVSVQVVRGDDESAEAFLTAARAATAVEDPRFLRVLDAAREAGHVYVVREWARGVSLDTVLQQGPLPAQRAAEVVHEVAEAIAAAHRAGILHGRIDPARIIVKHNGAVRVLGLATDQALHMPVHVTTGTPAVGFVASVGPAGSNGTGEQAEVSAAEVSAAEQADVMVTEQADVTALGRLLYACLVARWPGGRDLGLPAAPTEHGRLLRPRQVRAGVDPEIDDVVDRILGTPPRHHATALRSAGEVARELAVLSLGGDAAPAFGDDEAMTAHGVLPLAPDPAGPPPAIHQVPPPRTGPGAPPATAEPAAPRTGARGPIWLGIALLAGLAVLLGVLVGQVGSGVLPLYGDDDPTTTNPGRTPDQVGPLEIASISDFDPQGTDGGENPEDVGAALDSDPGTAWTTSTYFGYSTLGNLKDGVGLLVDLGKAQDVSRVDLTLLGGPTSLTVYTAPDASAPPSGVAGMTALGDTTTESAAPGVAVQESISADDPVSTRWVVVWLTDLPPDGAGDYKGQIAELAVVG